MADEVSHRVFMTGDGKRAVWERIRREARRCVSVVTNGELPGAAFRVPSTEYRVPSTEYRVPSTEYRVPSTGDRGPGTGGRA